MAWQRAARSLRPASHCHLNQTATRPTGGPDLGSAALLSSACWRCREREGADLRLGSHLRSGLDDLGRLASPAEALQAADACKGSQVAAQALYRMCYSDS
jgi:hypothetical protein